jgi:exopolysaccharide production protein ExoZ
MNTLFSIQILRAIAACAVALAHIHGDLKYHMGVSLMPVFSVGGVGVDIFFVISGFIMVYVSAPMFGAAGGPRVFLLRRIGRIAPLYWTATTLYIAIVLWALGRGALPGFDWAVASYLFVPYPGGNETFPVYSIGWTLNYEMFFYAVFAVVLIWPRRAAVAILAAAFVAWVGLGALVDLPAPMRFLSHAIVLEFVFGALLGLAFIEGIRLSRLVGRLMIAAALGILAVEYTLDYLPLLIAPIWPPRFVGLGIPAALIVGGAALQEPRPLRNPLAIGLEKLGDASYAIYLLHPMVFILARFAWPSVHGAAQLVAPAPWAGLMAAWTYATVVFALMLGISALTHVLFERPTTRYLTRALVGRRPSARREAAPPSSLASAAPAKE